MPGAHPHYATMDDAPSSCWTTIELAACGAPEHRQAFAHKYQPAIRAYLAARWRGTPLMAAIDDATQAVFVECLKEGGVLEKADPERVGGFRAFLYGTVRNVARRFESAGAKQSDAELATASVLDDCPDDETRISIAFDRAWARQIMKEAAIRMSERAAASGDEGVERVELLRLRFEEGLPIRTIAKRWDRPAETLHREYAKARREFHAALLAVIAFPHPDDPGRAAQECAHLLAVLS